MTGIEKPPQVVMKEGLETIVETVRLTEGLLPTSPRES